MQGHIITVVMAMVDTPTGVLPDQHEFTSSWILHGRDVGGDWLIGWVFDHLTAFIGAALGSVAGVFTGFKIRGSIERRQKRARDVLIDIDEFLRPLDKAVAGPLSATDGALVDQVEALLAVRNQKARDVFEICDRLHGDFGVLARLIDFKNAETHTFDGDELVSQTWHDRIAEVRGAMSRLTTSWPDSRAVIRSSLIHILRDLGLNPIKPDPKKRR
jgi:hypothetical protein